MSVSSLVLATVSQYFAVRDSTPSGIAYVPYDAFAALQLGVITEIAMLIFVPCFLWTCAAVIIWAWKREPEGCLGAMGALFFGAFLFVDTRDARWITAALVGTFAFASWTGDLPDPISIPLAVVVTFLLLVIGRYAAETSWGHGPGWYPIAMGGGILLFSLLMASDAAELRNPIFLVSFALSVIALARGAVAWRQASKAEEDLLMDWHRRRDLT